jgi:hypothetical protein
MARIYYKYENDYRNRNRFYDGVEGNNSVNYNSFVSTTFAEFYFKTNKRLEKINIEMPDIIPLGLLGMDLKPSSENTNRLLSEGTTITYNNQGPNTESSITIN